MTSHRWATMLSLLACVTLWGTVAGCMPGPSDTGDPNDPNGADPNDPNQADETWDIDPNDAPPPRYGHTMTSLGGLVYIFGGLGETVPPSSPLLPASAPPPPEAPILDDLWAFNSNNLNFDEIPVNPADTTPGRRHDHSADAYDGKLIIHGGKDPNHIPYRDTWSYDPNANDWARLSTAGPGVAYHASAVIGDVLIVVGGYDGSEYVTKTWVLDLTTNTWSPAADYPGSPLDAPVHGSYDGKMHVIDPDPNTVCTYDPASNTWEARTAGGTVPEARSNAGSFQVDEYLIAVGGAGTSDLLSDSFTYDMAQGVYRGAGDDAPVPTYKLRFALTGKDKGLAFGGKDGSGKPVSFDNGVYPFRVTTTFTNWSRFTRTQD